MRRDLLSSRTGEVLGAVILDGDEARFEGAAADVFGHMRRLHGDLKVARILIADGWSNGHTVLLGERR